MWPARSPSSRTREYLSCQQARAGRARARDLRPLHPAPPDYHAGTGYPDTRIRDRTQEVETMPRPILTVGLGGSPENLAAAVGARPTPTTLDDMRSHP